MLRWGPYTNPFSYFFVIIVAVLAEHMKGNQNGGSGEPSVEQELSWKALRVILCSLIKVCSCKPYCCWIAVIVSSHCCGVNKSIVFTISFKSLIHLFLLLYSVDFHGHHKTKLPDFWLQVLGRNCCQWISYWWHIFSQWENCLIFGFIFLAVGVASEFPISGMLEWYFYFKCFLCSDSVLGRKFLLRIDVA